MLRLGNTSHKIEEIMYNQFWGTGDRPLFLRDLCLYSNFPEVWLSLFIRLISKTFIHTTPSASSLPPVTYFHRTNSNLTINPELAQRWFLHGNGPWLPSLSLFQISLRFDPQVTLPHPHPLWPFPSWSQWRQGLDLESSYRLFQSSCWTYLMKCSHCQDHQHTMLRASAMLRALRLAKWLSATLCQWMAMTLVRNGHDIDEEWPLLCWSGLEMTTIPEKTQETEPTGGGKTGNQIASTMISCEKLFLPEHDRPQKWTQNKWVYKCIQIVDGTFLKLWGERKGCIIMSFTHRSVHQYIIQQIPIEHGGENHKSRYRPCRRGTHSIIGETDI